MSEEPKTEKNDHSELIFMSMEEMRQNYKKDFERRTCIPYDRLPYVRYVEIPSDAIITVETVRPKRKSKNK